MKAGFENFIKERRYLSNVTPATIEWYTHAFKWLDTDTPSQDDLKAAVLKMREPRSVSRRTQLARGGIGA